MCIDKVFYRWDGRLGIFLGWRIGVGCAGTGRFLFGMSTAMEAIVHCSVVLPEMALSFGLGQIPRGSFFLQASVDNT